MDKDFSGKIWALINLFEKGLKWTQLDLTVPDPETEDYLLTYDDEESLLFIGSQQLGILSAKLIL